ncbi:MAG TPA: carbohydrate-binding protein [Candidatus Obscuribacterales bacterium]
MDVVLTEIDVTNIPAEILTAYPGVTNAIANDGLDDAIAIQTVLDWVADQQVMGTLQGATIYIPEGVFDLARTLKVRAADITFEGAGADLTTVQNADTFQVGLEGLPDSGVGLNSINREAYLFDLDKTAADAIFTNMTLTGPEVHGAIFGHQAHGLEIHDMTFNNFVWSAVRLFSTRNLSIHDNEFIDAGGQAKGTSGVTGGSIYGTYLNGVEIYNNDISRSGERPGNVFGIKGRQFQNARIHHNTINTSFAIELPFENDRFVEIDHNFLGGTVSIPKFGGGVVPADGFTFHIHHNYFTNSYALEWARNGAEIDHNVFVFDTAADKGNLISNFGSEAASGWTKFHNNLVLNPGRGLMWSRGVYNNFSFYNNHVIANETITPRTEGLFGFNSATDFSTIEIRDNVIEMIDTARPLMRNGASYAATIANNTLVNVSDADAFANGDTGAVRGLLAPLEFQVGVAGEYTVEGADLRPTESNQAPTTSGLAPMTVTAGTATAVVPLSEAFADDTTAAADLHYAIAHHTNPGLFTALTVDETTDQLLLAFVPDQIGSSDVTISATNGVGLSVLTTMTVTVTTPITGPVRIQAEDYRAGTGGEYYDTSSANLGGHYRLDEPVDINATEVSAGYHVGWIKAKEYLTYAVEIAQGGLYDVVLRVATPRSQARKLAVTFDDGPRQVVQFKDTGGWQSWTDVTLNQVSLEAGWHSLRLDFLTADFNVDYLELVPVAAIA